MYKQLERVSPEMVGIPSGLVIRFLDILNDLEYAEPHGLMIMRHGKVFAEGWWAPYTPGRAHIAWSFSKTFAATAIGAAITEKKLTLDTTLVSIFPELLPENAEEKLCKLTVWHLLTMTGGMGYMSEDGPGWLQRFLNTPVEYEPGSRFMYNSMGSNTLGEIVRRVTGMPMEQYFLEKVAKKIGMNTEELYWTPIPDDAVWAAGGVYATTENMLRLMQLYLQNGVWDGEQILELAYVKAATSMQIDNKIGYEQDGVSLQWSPEHTVGYGFQMWMCSYPGAYRADGAQGQYGIVFPDLDMVFTITQTCEQAKAPAFLELVFKEFISRIPKEETKLEDSADYGHLLQKLHTLSLPKPVYAPYSAQIEKIQDREFKVTKGAVTLLTTFEPRELRGSGIRITNGIDKVKFHFEGHICTLSYVENDQEYSVEISLDGSREENHLYVPQHMPTEVLLSGYWEGSDCFIVKARWIQTSVEKTIRFYFEKDKLNIHAELTVGMMGGYAQPAEEASAVKERSIN